MSYLLDRNWSHYLYNTVGSLIFTGGVLLLALVQEWAEFGLSVFALMVQGLAILLVLSSRLWQYSRRFVAYPVILFCTIYLWDTKLPPPSLPDGWLRSVLPLSIVGLLLMDLAYANMQRKNRLRLRSQEVNLVPGYLGLVETARFLRITPNMLHSHLRQNRSTRIVLFEGREYIKIRDLIHVLGLLDREFSSKE